MASMLDDMLASSSQRRLVRWGQYEALVDDLDLWRLLETAKAIRSTKLIQQRGKQERASLMGDFDHVLELWREATDRVKASVEGKDAQSIERSTEVLYSYVQYWLIITRIHRDTFLASTIADELEMSNMRIQQQISILKEMVGIYDKVDQSLLQIMELPGAARDTSLISDLNRIRSFFRSKKCRSIGQFQGLKGNTKQSLALLQRARSLLKDSEPSLSCTLVSTDLCIDDKVFKTEAHACGAAIFLCLAEPTYFVANSLMDGRSSPASSPASNSLQRSQRILPVPIKPVFFDVAFDSLNYQMPATSSDATNTPNQSKRKGIFGFFGR